jgi:hypothetical protein
MSPTSKMVCFCAGIVRCALNSMLHGNKVPHAGIPSVLIGEHRGTGTCGNSHGKAMA